MWASVGPEGVVLDGSFTAVVLLGSGSVGVVVGAVVGVVVGGTDGLVEGVVVGGMHVGTTLLSRLFWSMVGGGHGGQVGTVTASGP